MPCCGVPLSGCYANHTPAATTKKGVYSVRDDGLTNDHFELRLPRDGRADLSTQDAGLWLVDSQTGEGCMSIALGFFQRWAQANPDKRFATVCSHVFSPSDPMLAWTGALRNVSVVTTFCAGLSPEDRSLRLQSLRRYIEFGIPCVAVLIEPERWSDVLGSHSARVEGLKETLYVPSQPHSVSVACPALPDGIWLLVPVEEDDEEEGAEK